MNTYVSIAIIVMLVIIIILSGILVYQLGLKHERKKHEAIVHSCSKSCKYITKRDLIYISIIGTIFIVIFATMALYQEEAFGEQLSFAGTISSIILSVLAIFMTIVGEQKQEGTKNAIDKATQEIADSASKLKIYADKINPNTLEEIQHSTKELEELLNTAIADLKEHGKIISKLEASIKTESIGTDKDVNFKSKINNNASWESKKDSREEIK